MLERVADSLTARVSTSPVGPTAPEPVVLPPANTDALRQVVRLLTETRGVARHEARVTPDLRAYGGALFDAVFRGAVLRQLRASLTAQDVAGRGLRLRLRLTGAPTLAQVPWELLYDPERRRFPSQYARYPTVRQVDVPEQVPPLHVDGAIRMLVVTASPTDLAEIDGDQEWRCLTAALRAHIEAGRLVVTRLPVATLDAVREALLVEPYHAFHFSGHGAVDPVSGEGILAFTDRYGRADWVPGGDLGVILSNAPIRLALLNSCEGARVNETDPYAATAIALVDNGIPAVVAMQFEISDKAAIAFSNATYLALTSSQPVDGAVTLARQAILTTSRNEWATPVLYLRTSDGTLFAWDRDAVADAARVDALSAPLEQPVGLQASSGARGVVLSWTAVAGEAGVRYEVYRDGRLVGETAEPSFTDPDGASSGEPAEAPAAYSVVAVDQSGRRSPSSAEVSPPPVAPPEPPGRRRSRLGPVLAAVLALVIVGVGAWVATGRPWPPGPTPPTPTTSTTSSSTTSAAPTTGTRTTSVPPVTGGLAVTLPRVTLVGAANQISVVTQVRNLGTQASTAGRSLVVTLTGPVKLVGPTEGCVTVPNGLRCSVPTLLSGASSQRVLAVSPPPDGQPVTVTAVLTPGDGGGNDTATRTVTCAKGVCDGAGPSPT
ncbi:MAG TPA: CHAT domain-containing protein [Lapillicoccus sp.]|nr:CHAT domain-containing protein [Lapillicoccus sp.]